MELTRLQEDMDLGGSAVGSFGGGSGQDATSSAKGGDFGSAASGDSATGVGGSSDGATATIIDGGDYAGGGANTTAMGTGGRGGFGAGGGAAAGTDGTGGQAGFGAGGGGGSTQATNRGFGGEDGLTSSIAGGAGAGFGGAIFIENGGTLTLGSSISFGGTDPTQPNSTTGRTNSIPSPSTTASSAGSDIFMMSGAVLNISSSLTIPSPIEGNPGDQRGIASPVTFSATADSTSSGYIGTLNKTESGILTLNGENSYTGNTTISGGGLTFGSASSVRSNIVLDGASTTLVIPHAVSINPFVDPTDNTMNITEGDLIISNGSLSFSTTGVLTVSGTLDIDDSADTNDDATVDLRNSTNDASTSTLIVNGVFDHASGTLALDLLGSDKPSLSTNRLAISNSGNNYTDDITIDLPSSYTALDVFEENNRSFTLNLVDEADMTMPITNATYSASNITIGSSSIPTGLSLLTPNTTYTASTREISLEVDSATFSSNLATATLNGTIPFGVVVASNLTVTGDATISARGLTLSDSAMWEATGDITGDVSFSDTISLLANTKKIT